MDSYDVIIVGTGAGGGTLARHLAPSGKRILLLERGDWLPREPSNWLAQDVFVDNLYVVDTSVFPSIGAVNPALAAMANSLRAGDHLLERLVGELAASGELDRLVASALGSPRTVELTDRIVRSDEFRGALRQIVASPELRAALTEQTAGIFDELIAELRRSAVGMDDRVEHAIRRPPRATGNVYAGIVSRSVAFAVDLFLIVAIFTVLSGFGALITSLVGTLRPTWLVDVLLGAGGAIVAAGYLILFWSGAGRTPGMSLLRVRVRGPDGGPPAGAPAVVRTFGTWLAIVPLFAGYLPVPFDRRRRGLPDYLAGTQAGYDDRRTTPASG